MTNYERIKKMSVKEMAELLEGKCCYCSYRDKKWCTYNDDIHCVSGTVKWLNSEVTEV